MASARLSPARNFGDLPMGYAITPKVTLRLAVTNLINQCFGGSTQAWTGIANPKTYS